MYSGLNTELAPYPGGDTAEGLHSANHTVNFPGTWLGYAVNSPGQGTLYKFANSLYRIKNKP